MAGDVSPVAMFVFSPRSKRGRDHQMRAHTLQGRHILWKVIPCQGFLDLTEMIIISEQQFTSSCIIQILNHWWSCIPPSLIEMFRCDPSNPSSLLPPRTRFSEIVCRTFFLENWKGGLDDLRMSRPSHSSSFHSTFSLQTSNRFRRESASSGYWPSLSDNSLLRSVIKLFKLGPLLPSLRF